jgi:hypothetical protein
MRSPDIGWASTMRDALMTVLPLCATLVSGAMLVFGVFVLKKTIQLFRLGRDVPERHLAKVGFIALWGMWSLGIIVLISLVCQSAELKIDTSNAKTLLLIFDATTVLFAAASYGSWHLFAWAARDLWRAEVTYSGWLPPKGSA